MRTVQGRVPLSRLELGLAPGAPGLQELATRGAESTEELGGLRTRARSVSAALSCDALLRASVAWLEETHGVGKSGARSVEACLGRLGRAWL